MSQAIARELRFGKNGNIYRLNAPVLIEYNAREDIVAQIKAAGKINLKQHMRKP